VSNPILRTCIGCHKKKRKKELARFFIDNGDNLLLDENNKGNKRGAYICSQDCLNLAIEKKHF